MRIKVNKLTEDFIIECSVTEKVDDVTRSVAQLHNLRLRVRRLVAGVRHLAKHGPMKPTDQHGLSAEQINAKGNEMKMPKDADPLGMRIGKACDPKVATILEKCAADAEALVSNQLFKNNVPSNKDAIEEALMKIGGAVKIAYPMGLPAWDPVSCAIDDQEDLGGMEDSKHVVEPDTCSMWFAGKQLMRNQDKAMSSYTGKNDKCIIKAKLEKKGAGAPQREPAIDAETKKAMMSRWHKKQAEQKALEEDDDDAYANSAWANPKMMSNGIHGSGAVKWRPGM